MTKAAQIVLDDLRGEGRGMQDSWDWPADYRFAVALNLSKEADMINACIESRSVTFFRMAGMYTVKKSITLKRLQALRELIKLGFVRTEWRGLGQFGFNDFGVRRTRAYFLKEEKSQ